MSRYCYVTGAEYRREDGKYVVARAREDRTKMAPAMVLDTLEEAEAQVTIFNAMLGLSSEDVETILAHKEKAAWL